MTVCDGADLTAASDACVRGVWAAVLPAVFVILVLFATIPPVHARLQSLQSTFANFMPLQEAETLLAEDEGGQGRLEDGPNVHLWRTLLLSSASLVETLLWVGVGCYSILAHPEDTWNGVRKFLTGVTWFYATLRPVVWPSATTHYDLVSLFSAHLLLGFFIIFGHLYDHHVHEIPMPNTLNTTVYILHLFAVAALLALVMSAPLAVPSKRIRKEDIGKSVSPEDYTSLWGWMSFRWVLPLLEKGTSTTLDEQDVWRLSPSFQTRPLHIKFSRTSGKLLKQLWQASSFDIVLDGLLTFVSVLFNYAGPFFLKRIIDALDGSEEPEKRANAYVYALLAFACTVCKTQTDAQHLWHGQRAATRIREILMASIYEKALKRKDFSGVVEKEVAGKTPGIPGTKEAPGANDPKAGADVGKIVNLMSTDVSRLSAIVSSLYLLYGSPFELILASVFLYQLLGWSAFAGFFVVVLSWPLNSLIAQRSFNVFKSHATARDKRLSVVNELITAVKFIKFFAWEDRWIHRALDARENEIHWMVKGRLNMILMSLIWACVPILVSVTAFFAYVSSGHELTIGTAFTAISLFQMVQGPLGAMPIWLMSMLTIKVAFDRVATYLGEDEVDEQVSSLKKGRNPPSAEVESGLGIVNGSFKWNEVQEKQDDLSKILDAMRNNLNNPAAAASTANETVTAEDAISDASTGTAVPDHHFELRDIDVMFPEGQLTVVVGPTASGKTALLMALLGELTTLGGRIVMSKNPSKVDEHGLSHTISYAAQTPWLRHQSIKDNILFGYPYDEARYNAVVRCCALGPDLEILEDGDDTEIGVRGVSLSGGQKARVALARAVYAPSKYVLLDDPLSAVDSQTARFLFDELFRGPLLANRTVILVTHHVELVLPGAHYLVRMLDGRIDTQGSIKDLCASGVLDDIAPVEQIQARSDEEVVEATKQEANPNLEVDVVADGDGTIIAAAKKTPRKFIEEEHRETGGVKWHIYNTYLKASSYWTWAILVFLILLTQLISVGAKFWIKIWGEAYGHGVVPESAYSFKAHTESQHVFHDHFSQITVTHAPTFPHRATGFQLPSAQENPYFYIGIYAAISLTSALVGICAVTTQLTGALRASRILFSKLLRSVVHATMRWHDTTPQGRLLNRFTKDLDTVDNTLVMSLQGVNQSVALLVISLLTIIYVFPLYIFPAVILGFFYRRNAIAYLRTGRDLRRMEANSRSPIFANFGELLEGIVTVRAFAAEQRFLNDLYEKVDLATAMSYLFFVTNRWLLMTFDILGATGTLITTIFALSGYVDAGIAAISITSAMSFTSSVYFICLAWTTLELDLNSVERVVEYLDLPQEPPTIIESSRPPAYWPSSTSQNEQAMLVVEGLTVKYAPDLPSVLRGVSFSLKAKERVGLIGRTGSGKSTLAMSILRFIDPAGGKIIIDGIDVCSIGLYDLRSRITFIPQEATLFSGTLRDNLDPFNEHTDAECLDALQRVQLLTDSHSASQHVSRAPSIHEGEAAQPPTAPSVSTFPTEVEGKIVITLDSKVSLGGTNFSQGQRQLIAMARALLRRSAIVVLDEATSSIDFATDAKIQATIREEFNDSLLLTIAHRLRTVIDYDRLIVLDKGELVEFDTPLNLIQKEGGIFREMCLKSGTFTELEDIARAKAERDSHD